jgi:DNA-directed RNA polymerase subunit RPC12/RpoP
MEEVFCEFCGSGFVEVDDEDNYRCMDCGHCGEAD